jgi:hypothetical protein
MILVKLIVKIFLEGPAKPLFMTDLNWPNADPPEPWTWSMDVDHENHQEVFNFEVVAMEIPETSQLRMAFRLS